MKWLRYSLVFCTNYSCEGSEKDSFSAFLMKVQVLTSDHAPKELTSGSTRLFSLTNPEVITCLVMVIDSAQLQLRTGLDEFLARYPHDGALINHELDPVTPAGFRGSPDFSRMCPP